VGKYNNKIQLTKKNTYKKHTHINGFINNENNKNDDDNNYGALTRIIHAISFL